MVQLAIYTDINPWVNIVSLINMKVLAHSKIIIFPFQNAHLASTWYKFSKYK